jgi:hypothetical protein
MYSIYISPGPTFNLGRNPNLMQIWARAGIDRNLVYVHDQRLH